MLFIKKFFNTHVFFLSENEWTVGEWELIFDGAVQKQVIPLQNSEMYLSIDI